MDRLVFGDVGFGKTEMAIRAAALAFRGGRQVAILAPTTVLARQHAGVFKRRLEPLGCAVELLIAPRVGDVAEPGQLKPRAEARRVRQAVADGTADVCIGTHALLSPKLPWRRLGLAVVDEEQRFGVKQKERFKTACVDVDLLTLSVDAEGGKTRRRHGYRTPIVRLGWHFGRRRQKNGRREEARAAEGCESR